MSISRSTVKTKPSARSTLSRRRFEGRPLLAALVALHAGARRRSPDAVDLAYSVAQSQGHLGLPDTALPAGYQPHDETALTSTAWLRLGEALNARLVQLSSKTSLLEEWLPPVAQTMGLSQLEAGILGLALGYEIDTHFERLWDRLCVNRGRTPCMRDDAELFALLLGCQDAEVRLSLEPDRKLRTSGLISINESGCLEVLGRLSGLLVRRTPPAGDVKTLLLSTPRLPELPWEAFAHLGTQAEMAAKLLAAALANREPGVGILLYGPPGTGKTSFSAALASRVGANLYPVGEADSEGRDTMRRDRLAELQISQQLLGNTPSVLLFDEAEDLFSDPRTRGNKVFLHRQLEEGSAPVIWTANDIDVIGPAMVRRMMMCVEVRQPNVTMRANLWSDMARLEAVSLSPDDAAELARIVPAAPAIMRNAMRATRLAGGGSETARMVGTGIAQAVAGGRLPRPEQTAVENYDPMLIQADCDLAQLVQRFTAAGATQRISLLLSGPPGSGKSAFARHLAVAMKLPILQKRASDLISPFVGQTEQQIAEAFAEATNPSAFLIFDEADSLLADRRGADRGWEVSQVNEMLTWMESHPLPFVCTTNLPDKLDLASMRRFLFKVRFGYLTQTQNRLAFARFFQMPAPSTIDGVENLTPSDFALVRRRASLLGKEAQPDTLLAMLKAEAAGRGEVRPIGFISRN